MAENSARVNSSIQITNTPRVLLLITTVFGHCIKHAFSAAFFILIPEIKTSLGFTNSEIGGLSAIRNVHSVDYEPTRSPSHLLPCFS